MQPQRPSLQGAAQRPLPALLGTDSESKTPLATSKGFANLLRSLSVLLGTLVDQPGGPRTALLHKGRAATSVWPLCTHLARGQARAQLAASCSHTYTPLLHGVAAVLALWTRCKYPDTPQTRKGNGIPALDGQEQNSPTGFISGDRNFMAHPSWQRQLSITSSASLLTAGALGGPPCSPHQG